MSKIVITTIKILLLIATTAVVILYFALDIHLARLQLILVSLLMFICAYEQKLKKKHIMVVWLLAAAGIFSLIVAFIVIQPFF